MYQLQRHKLSALQGVPPGLPPGRGVDRVYAPASQLQKACSDGERQLPALVVLGVVQFFAVLKVRNFDALVDPFDAVGLPGHHSETITREGADGLLQWLTESDFFVAPASTRFHGSHEGGLLQHSLNVYDYLKRNVEQAGLQDTYSPETIAVSALLHDVCKVNFYTMVHSRTTLLSFRLIRYAFACCIYYNYVYICKREARLSEPGNHRCFRSAPRRLQGKLLQEGIPQRQR